MVQQQMSALFLLPPISLSTWHWCTYIDIDAPTEPSAIPTLSLSAACRHQTASTQLDESAHTLTPVHPAVLWTQYTLSCRPLWIGPQYTLSYWPQYTLLSYEPCGLDRVTVFLCVSRQEIWYEEITNPIGVVVAHHHHHHLFTLERIVLIPTFLPLTLYLQSTFLSQHHF